MPCIELCKMLSQAIVQELKAHDKKVLIESRRRAQEPQAAKLQGRSHSRVLEVLQLAPEQTYWYIDQDHDPACVLFKASEVHQQDPQPSTTHMTSTDAWTPGQKHMKQTAAGAKQCAPRTVCAGQPAA